MRKKSLAYRGTGAVALFVQRTEVSSRGHRVGFGLDQQASRVAARRRNFSLIFTKIPDGQWIPASLFQKLLGLR